MKILKYCTYATVFLFLFSLSAQAAPGSFVLQGQIIKPDAMPLEESSVSFTVQVFSPGSEQCLLYEESFSSVNMTNTNGLFSLTVGTGARIGSDYHDTSTLDQIMNNEQGNISSLTCSVGTDYNPGASDQRKVRLTFDDGTGPVTVGQDYTVNSVPFAQYAKSVGGLERNQILQVNGDLSQANLETVFATAGDTAELRNLIDGNSSSYMVTSPGSSVDFNGQQITGVANPSNANDVANKDYSDGNIGGRTVDGVDLAALGAGQAGEVLTWNGTSWDSQAVSTVDNSKLALAGGTMTGAINMGNQDITNANTVSTNAGITVGGGIGVTTGINSGGNIAVQAESEVRFEDNSGGEYMAFKAPASVTASTVLTLPDGDGSANQVLATDGSGNLIWANDANTDAVDTVFGRTGAVVAASGDYNAGQVTNTAAGNIAATDVQAAIDELDSEKVQKSGDSMTGNLQLSGGSNLVLEGGTSGTVSLLAPATVTSYSMELPNAAGTTGQVLKADASGNLTWSSDIDTDTDTTYTADGDGIELSGTTFNIELDGSTLAKGASGLSVNSIADGQIAAGANIARSKLAAGSANRVVVNDGSGNLVDAAAITANMALISDANGIPVADTNIDTTELGYLNNVSSNIQTQLDGKQASLGFTPVDVAGDTMTGNLIMNASSSLQLTETAGTGELVTLSAPADATAAYSLVLPDDDGTSGQVLQTDGSGNLSWASASVGSVTNVTSTNSYLSVATGTSTPALTVNVGTATNTVAAGDDSRFPGATCGAGNKMRWDGSAWQCEADVDTDTTYTADGDGIELSGTTFNIELDGSTLAKGASGLSVNSIADGQIAAGANIARSKLAAGSANRVVVNDGSGNLVDAAAITANMALISDANGIPVADTNIDTTELGYLNNVSSNIQTQLDGKQASLGFTPVDVAGDTMTGNLVMNASSSLQLTETAGTGELVTLSAPADATAAYSLVLPTDDGGSGEVLQTDGSGNLSWVALGGGGDFFANGSVPMTGNLNLETQSEVRFQDDTGGEYVALRAPTGVTSYTMELPAAAGSTNQVLKLNASGNLIWANDVDTDTDTDTTYTADGSGIELSGTTFNIELDGSTLAKGASGLSVNSIADGQIAAGANIARSKIAAGSANRVVVNDGSGNLVDAAAITANMALISDANGIPVADTNIDTTELGYLNNVSSNIQTQLDGKQASLGFTPVDVAGDTMTGNLILNDSSSLQLTETGGTGELVTLSAPADATAAYSLVLPTDDGGSGEVLQTDGSGNLSWVALGGGGDFFANGSVPMTGNLNLETQSEVRFQDDTGGEYVALRAPTGVTSYTMELPAAAGSTNQVLKLNGSGNLIWANDVDTDTDTDTTYTADGDGIELSGTTFNIELDGSTLAKGASGLSVNSIADGQIAAGANIARSKIAAGSANRVVVNDGSGNLVDAAAITANMALISDANGIPVADTNIDTTELGYLNNVSSNIQTQLDGKQASLGFTPVDVAGDTMTGNLIMNASSSLQLTETGGTGELITLSAPADATAAYSLIFPVDDGTSGQVLQTDGSGNLSWVALGGGGDFFANGSVPMTGNLNLETQSEVRFQDDTGGEYVALRAPTGVTSYTMELPAAAGSTNQVLKLNASGNLIWANDVDTDTDTDTTYTADGSGIELSGTTFNIELDGSTLAKGASGLSVNSIADGQIAAGANIARSKLAAGSANRVVVNDGSGNLVDAAAITANMVLISDANGIPVADTNIDTTELGYLNNVSSNIQTQLDGKQASLGFTPVDVAGDTMTGNLIMNASSSLQLTETGGTGELITLSAPADATAAYSLIFPVDDGTSGQVLQTDGSGNLSWVALGGGGDFFANGSVPMTGNLNLETQSEVRFQDDTGGEYVALRAPTGVTSYTMELPAAAGSTNQVLKLNASGNLIWANDVDTDTDTDTTYTADGDGIELSGTTFNIELDGSTLAKGASGLSVNSIADGQIAAGANIARSKLAAGSANRVVVNDGSGNLVDAAAITANMVLISDANGIPVADTNIDTTELGYLNNVSSNIQTQLDGKQASLGFTPVDVAGDTMTGNLIMNASSSLQLTETGGTGELITLSAPADATAAYSLVLPTDDGGSGEVLQTDGSGNLSWVALGGGGDFFANGSVPMTGNLNLETQSEVRFQDDTGGEYVALRAPTGVTSYTMELPAAAGSTNQVLKLNASGNLIWANDVDTDTDTDTTYTADGDGIELSGTTFNIELDGSTLAKGASGLSVNSIADGQIAAGANIARSKIAAGSANRVVVNDGSGNLVDAAAITGNMALISDANGIPVADTNIDTTELGYLNNVSSNIQTQLDGKQASLGFTPVNIAGDSMTGNLALETESEVRFEDNTGGEYVGFKAPTAVTTSYTMELPGAAGTSGQVLKADASGNLVWGSDNDSGGTGDLTNGGNSGAVTVGSNDSALVLESNNTAAITFDTAQDMTFTGNLLGFNLGHVELRLDADSSGTSESFSITRDSGASLFTFDDDEIHFHAGGRIRSNDGGFNLDLDSDASSPTGEFFAISKDNLSTELMRLDENGSLGLGTSSPSTTLDVHGRITADVKGTAAGDGGSIVFEELDTNGQNFVGFRAPDSITTDLVWQLPAADGSSGQVLQTNGSGVLSWAAAGGSGDFLANGSVAMTGAFEASTGAAATPSITFDGDENTGIYNSAADQIAFSTNGSEKMRLDGNGDLSIGTTTPNGQVHSHITSTGTAFASSHSSFSSFQIGHSSAGVTFNITGGTGTDGDLIFSHSGTFQSPGGNQHRFKENGRVGFNVSDPSTQLHVGGRITADVKGTAAGDGGSIIFEELDTNGQNFVGFRAPDALAGDVVWELPAVDGSANQVLQTNGSGVLSWASPGGSGDITNGGNSFGAAMTIGTNDNQQLNLEVNNSTKLEIWDNGTVRFAGAGSRIYNGRAQMEDGADASFPAYTFEGDADTGMFEAAADEIGFSTNGTEKMRLDSNGFLGIGTDNPAAHLSIHHLTNPAIELLDLSGGAETWHLEASVSGFTIEENGAARLFVEDGGSFEFRNRLGNTVNMLIEDGGNTGIGTTAPSTKLDVHGRITADVKGTAAGDGGSIVFEELDTNGQNFVGFRAPDALAGDVVWELPAVDGSSGQVLQTNGAGVLSWSSLAPGDISQNGNSFGANMVIGTNDAFELDFETNGTARMTVTDLGFYTTIPLMNSGSGNNSQIQLNATGTEIQRNVADANPALVVNQVHASSTGDIARFSNSSGVQAVIDEDGHVGVGTDNPGDALVIEEANDSVTAVVRNTDSSSQRFPGYRVYNYMGSANSGRPILGLTNSRGTDATSGAIQSGDYLGSLIFEGVYNTGSSNHNGAFIDVIAEENFAAGAAGSNMRFSTSSLGATSPSEKMRISADGNVGVGTSTPHSTLTVNGAIANADAIEDNAGAKDFATGNIQYTTASCGAFDLHNMKSGGIYSFVVQGSTSATCSFNMYSDGGSTALTVHMPTDHGATDASTHTVYSVMVAGSHAYVSWIKGL